ncbi:MAG: asparagine synthase (glutamine-hydrolyzing) [bacterium]|nr:asparagine synthase (glutamine-hydrolyzing) [bacterium]
MCGIIAIAGKKVQSTKDDGVEKMLSCLSLRGPDEKAFTRTSEIILGQTRLSIVDLALGHQPMKDNTHPLSIVFNGEIYGYKDLRIELEKQGHVFSTNSDTEVILKAYVQYGKNCVDHIDGMFAFALWDDESKELFIARDRFGKKPLYYHIDDSSILIASEIKAIQALGVKTEIDRAAIDNYLALMYIPPWKSVYKNIYVLPPAHRGFYKDGIVKIDRYWKLEDKPVPPVSYEEAKSKVKKLLDEAVKKRMVADVEIGSLLSGGVDSTLVTAYAQKYTGKPLKTFSVGYEGYINELPFALTASRKIGTDHHTLQASSDLILELEKVMSYFDEPHADTSNFPQHMVSELAGKHVKVALSGDGADELFMGYGWYWKYWNTKKILRLKNFLFSNPFKEHMKSIQIFSEKERSKLWKNPGAVNGDIIDKNVREMRGNGIKKINLFDLTTYLPGQLLSKVDRTSMMHSLEIRSPFLDYKLAEYAYNLPLEHKTDKKGGKIILKDILGEIMPEEFVHRRKQGFGAPVTAWLRTEKMREYVSEKLGEEALSRNFLSGEAIEELLKSFYGKGDDSLSLRIWTLLCLELWFRSRG